MLKRWWMNWRRARAERRLGPPVSWTDEQRLEFNRAWEEAFAVEVERQRLANAYQAACQQRAARIKRRKRAAENKKIREGKRARRAKRRC